MKYLNFIKFILIFFPLTFSQFLFSQVLTGTIDLTNKFTFIGQFNGFNDGPFSQGQGMGINATLNPCTNNCGDGSVDSRFYGLETDLRPIHRFPGGTVANYYHRWYGGYGYNYIGGGTQIYNDPNYKVTNSGYNSINYTQRGQNDVGPVPSQSKNNIIFPFINKLTQHGTVNSLNKTNFVLNLLNHYRRYTLNGNVYFPRYDIFYNKSIIDSIDNLTELVTSGLKSETKDVVLENLDALKTLIDNGVDVKDIEFGNEYCDNNYCKQVSIVNETEYTNFLNGTLAGSERQIWYYVFVTDITTVYDIKSRFTLDCFASLCAMYRRIINNQYLGIKTFKYGIPFGPAKWNSFQNQWLYLNQQNIWNNYLVSGQKNFIGYDAVCVHRYPGPADSINSSLTNDNFFTQAVSKIDNCLEQNIWNHALTRYSNTLPANTEIWYTEWNWANLNGDSPKNKRFNNTLLDIYGKTEFLFSFIDGNTFHPIRKNLYTLANHHFYNNFYSDNPQNYEGGLFNMYYDNTSKYVLRAPYYAFKIMQPIIDNTLGYKYVLQPKAGFSNVPSGLKFRAFFREETNCNNEVGELLLYYANTTGNPYYINLNDYFSNLILQNPSFYILSSQVKNYTVWANKLYASRGASYGTTGSNGNNDSDLINFPNDPIKTIQVMNEPIGLTSSEIQNYLIKGYSIGYIKIPIRKYVSVITCLSRVKNPNTSIEKDDNLIEPIFFPNPSSKELSIILQSFYKESGRILFYDLKGTLVKEKNVDFDIGENKFNIEIFDLPNSYYVVNILSNNSNITKKIEIIH